MSPLVITIVIIAALLLFALVGFLAFRMGIAYRRKIAEAEIGGAEEEAAKILEKAKKDAEAKKKEVLVEAKEEIQKSRSEFEKEAKERRNDLTRQERRIQQKEENLDKKSEQLDKKNEILDEKIKNVEHRQEELEGLKKTERELLERIAGLSAEEAKEYLLKNMETEIRRDAAVMIKEIEDEARDEAEQKARMIICNAVQSCTPEYSSEITVSVVALPNEDMKGRIIGREGRNIRAIETATGVDVIIDDTPEAVVLSAFDPVRREIARIAMEKLIADGRIHPARIEEMVESARKEVESAIKKAGEQAVLETGVTGLHPEIVRMLGRLKYRTSYGQNVLQHSLEVAYLSGQMAAELGVDVRLAKRAGLLHDLGKAIDHEIEGSHVELGFEFAKKYNEGKEVLHAIQAHHGDVPAQTVIASLVQAADAISAARPGARRENIETYIKRLEKLEQIANEHPGVMKSYAIQAGREIRVAVKPEQVADAQMPLVAREIAKRIEEETEYPGQIKVSVVRETRHIDFAK